MSGPGEPLPGLFAPDDDDRSGVSSRPRRRRGIGLGLGVALAAVVLVAGAGVGWYVYDESRAAKAGDQLPVIRADSSPIRVEPDDPGGIKVEHQDRMIFEDPKDEQAAGDVVERLLPRQEKPVALAVPAPAGAEPTQEPAAPAAPAAAGDATGAAAPAADAEAAVSATGDAPTPASPTAETAAAPTEARAAPAMVRPEPARRFRIQLGAFGNAENAQKAWRKMRDAHGQQLGTLALTVQKAQVAGKGEVFRIQAGPLVEAEAAAVCIALKAREQPCLVVRR